MPQFLIEPSNIKGDTATLSGADSKHIVTVLRLRTGDWIMLTDGRGDRFKATILEASPKKVIARIHPSNPSTEGQQRTSIVLAQAMIKHDRFEWVIQKSVELGCSRIMPFTSKRTIPKFHVGKLERWQKIADEAAKQCGTGLRPKISAAIPLDRLFKDTLDIEQRILFYEGESSNGLETCQLGPVSTLIMIGPEGGFAADEVENAKNAGFHVCGLGPLILRVETAAIAGLTLVQNKLGYFNGR